jgi:hypothetical protein
MENYGVFLMAELLRANGVLAKDLEYDLVWESAWGYFNEYDDSKFNVETAGEYECIQAFIEDKFPKEIENLLKKDLKINI